MLLFDKTDGTHEFREYQEMKSHNAALKMINEWANDSSFTLTEMHIKQLNGLLLVEPFWKEAITESGQATKRLIEVGQYKKFSNSVRLAKGEIFEYVSPIDTPIKMGELMSWYNLTLMQDNLTPIELAALFITNLYVFTRLLMAMVVSHDCWQTIFCLRIICHLLL